MYATGAADTSRVEEEERTYTVGEWEAEERARAPGRVQVQVQPAGP